MRPRFQSYLLPALAVISLGACHKAKPAPTPEPVAAAPPPMTITQEPIRSAPPPARTPVADPNAAAREREAAIAMLANTIGAPVFFDYDKSDLRDEAKAVLDAKVPILQANKAVRIRIAGNTDERGSDEYNLALGQRRAAAARAYLKARGIDEARMDIVSYGEERPVQQGDNDAARSKNRRDEFEIVAGRETIQPVRR